MMPTMVLVGVLLGLLPRRWPHCLAVVVGVGLLASLGMGLVVGAHDAQGRVGLVAGASLLMAVNASIGVLVGRGLQAAASKLAPPLPSRAR